MTTLPRITTLDLPQFNRFAVGFDNLFDQLHRRSASDSNNNYPPYNIVKYSDTEYSVEFAVAGFDERELDIELKENKLVVTGTRDPSYAEPGEYLHHGISKRNFSRTINLAENIVVNGATVKNGMLTVSLERVVPESAKPKKIPITFSE